MHAKKTVDYVLDKPTVAQFIEILQRLPPDRQLRMIDADTSWTIEIIHIYDGEFPDPETVWLEGKYFEMKS